MDLEGACSMVFLLAITDIWRIWVGSRVISSVEESLIQSGSILLCGIAIVVTLGLIWRSERKQAAVGRRFANLVPKEEPGLIDAQRISAFPCRLPHRSNLRDFHSWGLPSSRECQIGMSRGRDIYTSDFLTRTPPGFHCSPSWGHRCYAVGASSQRTRRISAT